MNLCEKANIRLIELDQIIIGLFDQRIILAGILKESAGKELKEYEEWRRKGDSYREIGLFYNMNYLNYPQQPIDIIKQADELIAQSKQMKEMLLNLQDSEVKENENRIH